jgi:uncharacterized protein (TIGR02001 family)
MSKLTRTLLVPLIALCFAGLFTTSAVQAQSVDVGGTLASRYVWRGLDFGNAAAVQPSLSYSQGGFTVGAWGSFEMSPVGGSATNENDLYASYTFDLGDSGSISLSVTDFYFSTGANDFFEFDNEAVSGPGGHQIEPGISYSGPVTVSASVFAYGHGDENEIWLEAAYPFSVKDVDLSLALGGTPNDGAGFYGTDADTDAGLTKVSLSASKSIEITDSFSLPISASYYVNPYLARSYFIFGISL